MRASNKGLKNLTNIVECPGCGKPKLMHHLCKHCYRNLRLRIRAELKEEVDNKEKERIKENLRIKEELRIKKESQGVRGEEGGEGVREVREVGR
ncbi:hypothetical protein BC936DRAFT_140788 [Jimgerdemannia flammicorona]|uniref:Uncharacterized protein n=1 Tax=Jimgerdemannia flammicorona TaxID=994334 RepID=A0A433A4J9_9FUNG|nr:hypothetical protein BC936DRAFT_140788 [Jimgerdemannia flammicorona]